MSKDAFFEICIDLGLTSIRAGVWSKMEMARRWKKWPRDRLGWSKMVKKKGLGWPGNGLKLLEIDSEWSQVDQLNGQELGKDGEDKR